MTDKNTDLTQIKLYTKRLFDIVKRDANANECHFVLFLLVLHKERILKGLNLYSENNVVSEIYANIREADSHNMTLYLKIWELFEPYLSRVKWTTLCKILDLLEQLNNDILQNNFVEIFDEILDKLIKSQGRSRGGIMLPSEVSKFLMEMVKLPSNAEVYNPFAGLASLGVFAQEDIRYIGQEVDNITWALGQLRLIAHGRYENSKYINSDSIDKWNPMINVSIYQNDIFDFLPKNYDLIIANPPFNLRLSDQKMSTLEPVRSVEQFILNNGIKSLKDNGLLVLISSLEMLFRRPEYSIREYLVNSDMLEMVIELPNGLLSSTSIPMAIIVVSKRKKQPGYVTFINATSMIDNSYPNEKRLDVAELIGIVESKCDSDNVRIVANNLIEQQDYNLSVPLYFKKEVDGSPLEELATIINRRKEILEDIGKYIRIKDLKDDTLDFRLDLNSVVQEYIPLGQSVQKISESCILLASKWNTLKPTFFEYTGESIFITPDIIALKIDESKVDIAYLINELHGDYIKEQLDSYRIGSVIPVIRKDSLLRVKIQLPSLSEQIAKIRGVREANIASKRKQLQLEQELLGLEDSTYRELASMKHTLRQYLSALKSNVLGTKKFISNHEGLPIKLDTIYSKNLSQTFEEHLNSIEGTIDSMSKVLSSLDEKSNDFDNSRNQNLYTLVVNAYHRFTQQDIFEFQEVCFDKDSFESEDPIINISEQDFYKLFSNIVSNAINHGFKNSTKRNIIRIFLSYNPSLRSCELEISNNGRPISKQFTLQHLTTRGEKTADSDGSGIGGADIKAIVEKYKGYFDLATDEENDFPVTYILGFPLLIPNEDEI